MSEISNIPSSPSHPRTDLRESQPVAGGAQLGQVEEEAGEDDANTTAAFQRAAHGILGRPYVYDRPNPTFDRGQYAGFIQAQRHTLSQYSPPINQNQIDYPFEGSVHIFDNIVNTREFGARFLRPHVAEGRALDRPLSSRLPSSTPQPLAFGSSNGPMCVLALGLVH
jgi:hypothetical protein